MGFILSPLRATYHPPRPGTSAFALVALFALNPPFVFTFRKFDVLLVLAERDAPLCTNRPLLIRGSLAFAV